MNESKKESVATEVIEFSGHPNILATHYNTIEVTKASAISRRADCIIGVNATKACTDLSDALKKHIQSGGRLSFGITVERESFSFSGRGRKELTLKDSHELVLRRSDFVSDRTGAISCDAAAIDLPRKLVKLLQNGNAKGALTITAIDSPHSEDMVSPLFIES